MGRMNVQGVGNVRGAEGQAKGVGGSLGEGREENPKALSRRLCWGGS